MDNISHDFDVVVVGGGLAGICAALAAARSGAKTGLVEQRHVLGGNASSLIRVHIGGAPDHGWHFDARETGIIEELRLSYALLDPENSYTWIDHVLDDACSREKLLSVFYNITIDAVKIVNCEGYTQDKREYRIISCVGNQQGSETKHEFNARIFIDGTGDGTVGALAGADFRMGRESRSEFGESIAPEKSDNCILGSSILFEARNTGHPVSYTPPSWANRLPKDYSNNRRNRQPTGGRDQNGYWHGKMRVGWWWNEYGGKLDTIKDNEKIRRELLANLHGLWDHVKNSGDPRYTNAKNYCITWIGSIPGKRESRRLIGDYILKETDVSDGVIFPDQIAAGGWNIDLHPPGGFYDELPPAQQVQLRDLYTIPYRCIYSRNVTNLLIASRCISVTHVAHGTTRLQATLATVGQAAGLAAALCVKNGLMPRDIGNIMFNSFQQELLKHDGFLLELCNADPADQARTAHVVASSVHPLRFTNVDHWIPLMFPVAQQFPVIIEKQICEIKELKIFVKNDGINGAKITGGLRESKMIGDFGATTDIARFSAIIPPQMEGKVCLSLDRSVIIESSKDPGENSRLMWFYIDANADNDHLYIAKDKHHYPGFRNAFFDEDIGKWQVPRIHDNATFFTPILHPRGVFCFEIDELIAFPAANVNNGYHRPSKHGSNLWLSDPAAGMPQWLEIHLLEPCTISEIHITCDNDLDKPYPHLYEGDYDPWLVHGRPPRSPRNIDVIAIHEGTEHLVGNISDNYQRKIILRFSPIKAEKVKFVMKSTNGAKIVGIYEVRIY